MSRKLCLLCSVLFIASFAQADDWPRWRGVDNTDVSKETGLLKEWPSAGPKQLWVSDEAGLGYSGFSTFRGTLYTMGSEDGVASLIALSESDGKKKWSTPIGDRLENGWGGGPRATPTVDGDLVYAMSGPGDLICAKTSDGSIVWKKSMKDFGGRVPNWGYCESVLVDGDKVVCTPGGRDGAMLALNKKTGDTIWQSKDFTEGAQYSSIVVAEHNGKRQYIQLTQKKLAGIDSATGDVLWSSDWQGRTAVIPTPIFADGHVYIASGYGVGCKLVKINEDNTTTDVYVNKVMKNHHGGVLKLGDHLYGHSDRVGWVCQDFKTGESVWIEKRAFNKGAVTCADGMLYCVEENTGRVKLVSASPEGWEEHGTFTIAPQTKRRSPRGKVWTHPVITNGKLIVRDQEFVVAYDVKG